jgi:TolB-like protein
LSRRLSTPLLLVLGSALAAACAPGFRSGSAYRLADPFAPPPEASEHLSHADIEKMKNRAVDQFEQGEYARAIDLLETVREADPEDGRTLFYLGVSYEYTDQLEKALEAYGHYTDLRGQDRRFRRKMLGRIEALNRIRFERYAQGLVTGERELPTEAGDALAVLQFEGGATEAGPLALGLSELLTTDLSKARDLQVVERLRMQAILDELKLARSEAVDPSTAPRVGRLLGAGRLVSGTLTDLSDDQIRIEAYVVRSRDGSVLEPASVTGPLESFFDLEKDLAFAILEDMGIRLTIDEERAIREVPTRNFLAYMAYCDGLSLELSGRYREAMGKYNEAFSRDRSFEAAGVKTEALGDLLAGAGSSPAAGAGELTQAYQEMAARTDILQGQLDRMMGWVTFFPDPSFGDRFDPSDPRTSEPGRGSIDVEIILPRRQ